MLKFIGPLGKILIYHIGKEGSLSGITHQGLTDRDNTAGISF